MAEIIAGITTLAAYPIQSILIIAALVVWIYWFIKIRPKELAEKLQNGKERDAVMEKLIEVMTAQRIAGAETCASYDKLAEHSIRVIENNTSTLQVTLHNLEMFTRTFADKIKQDDASLQMYKDNQTDVLRILHDIQVMVARLLERYEDE